MKIIKPFSIGERTDYRHQFNYVSNPNAGYSFPCNEHGILEDKTKKSRLQDAHNNPELEYVGIVPSYVSWRNYAIGICDCGADITLSDGLDNFCDNEDCNRCFNMSGDAVLPSWHPMVEENYWPEEPIAGFGEYDDLW